MSLEEAHLRNLTEADDVPSVIFEICYRAVKAGGISVADYVEATRLLIAYHRHRPSSH